MRLLVSSIITGFGLKLGADIYKYVKQRLGIPDDEDNKGDLAEGQAAEQQS